MIHATFQKDAQSYSLAPYALRLYLETSAEKGQLAIHCIKTGSKKGTSLKAFQGQYLELLPRGVQQLPQAGVNLWSNRLCDDDNYSEP